MNWLEEINEFPGFDLNVVSTHIYKEERQLANAKYNKALKNAREDSVDIAIIELRKLSVLYPQAGQIPLLLGCCQMLDDKPEDALKSFRKAETAILPLDLETRIGLYIQESKRAIEKKFTAPAAPHYNKYPIRSVPPIIEAKPSRWKKTKIASKREKREVMKRLGNEQKEETMIRESMSVNWLKTGMVAGISVLVLAVAAAAVFYLPRAIRTLREAEAGSGEKLEWLINRLTVEGEKESFARDILDEYDARFYPEPALSHPEASDDPVSTAPTAVPPTPTPEPTVNDLVLLAALAIGEAEAIGMENPKRVYELIESAREYLDGIDQNAVAKGLETTAEDISVKALQLERSIVNVACYQLYSRGRAAFNEKQYQEAVSFHEQVADINAFYLDGGNMYNLGKAYAETGEREKANQAFQFVIDYYPGTDVAGWASARIRP